MSLSVAGEPVLGEAWEHDGMAWATPRFSRNQVDKAGKVIAEVSVAATLDQPFLDSSVRFERMVQRNRALIVIDNWRSSHTFPLNIFRATLRSRAKRIDAKAIVAQRIKRIDSIVRKLRSGTMQLSQMQDIGGCRAIVATQDQAIALAKWYEEENYAHSLIKKNDYILNPKEDGYRGLHLIYGFVPSEKTMDYKGLKVEIQIRSLLQHAWATAVEAVGIFTKQALKSGQGSEDWKRFFVLMGSVIARMERTSSVPGAPSDERETLAEIRQLNQRLKILDSLSTYSDIIEFSESNKLPRAAYFLIKMDFDEQSIHIFQYAYDASQAANKHYTELEESSGLDRNSQVVLVSVDSIESLKQAYPNYFLDTKNFTAILSDIVLERG